MEESKNNDLPPLRESLIATAVAFLKNEKVKGSPLEDKKSFLLKKGLTMAEIEESIRIGNIPLHHDGPPPPLPPLPTPSTFSRLTSSASTLLIMTGSAYALYHLYQKFLQPLLFGKQQKEEEEEEVLQQLLVNSRHMNENLVAMVTTLNDLHRQVARSNSQLLLNNNSQEYRLATNEMKEEIRSLKALLLSRDQFPSAPSTRPLSLPAWQIESKTTANHVADDKSTVLNGGDNDGDDDAGETVCDN